MEIALFSSLIIFISNVYLNFKMSLNEQSTALISFIHMSSTKWLFLYRDALPTDIEKILFCFIFDTQKALLK